MILALAMCVSMGVPALAANDIEVLSFEEYYLTLQEEYSKYNIQLEIVEHNADYMYTRELLSKQIAYAKEFAEGITVTRTDYISNENKMAQTDNLRSSRNMPLYFYYSADFTISANNPTTPAYADFTFVCDGDVNVQNGQVISVDHSLQNTYSINMKSNHLNTRCSVYDSGNIQLFVSGPIVFAWTDPFTSSTFETTVNEIHFAQNFDPEDHIG